MSRNKRQDKHFPTPGQLTTAIRAIENVLGNTLVDDPSDIDALAASLRILKEILGSKVNPTLKSRL